MITVDPVLCAYCGGCVSICPVGALSLAETRLLVAESCIDCGDCVLACPMGALRSGSGDLTPTGRPFRPVYDVVVVGAGPGGSVAAETVAKAGLRALLLEKRQEIGSPVRCAEGVGHNQLVPFIEPDPLWIAAEVSQAEITVIRDGASSTIRASGGRGYVLERRVFDRVLAERAAAAGAEVRVKTAATNLLWDDGCVVGVTLERGDLLGSPGPVDVQAQVVIAADGVEGQVGRWGGLLAELPLVDTMTCLQYTLAGIEIDPSCTGYTFDYEIAPGGYAWVFPKGDGKANVGLGLQADLCEPGGVNGAGSVLGRLTRFIEERPALACGYPVTLVAGNVPVAPPPAHLVGEGLMLVGDAARQVDPLTGGGICNAMEAGQLAAQVAVEAIQAGDRSAACLGRYQEVWMQGTGRRLLRNQRVRQRFPPAERAAERFVRAFALAAGG